MTIQTSYFLYKKNQPVDRSSPHWQDPLPLNPCAGLPGVPAQAFCIGDYFTVAHEFVTRANSANIVKTLSMIDNQPVTYKSITQIDIILEKHGEFYHPARLEIKVSGKIRLLVLNVAVSATGRNTLSREFKLLMALKDRDRDNCIPRVYVMDQVRFGGLQIPMFIGQWFDGFHEFHLTKQDDETGDIVRVWDSDNTDCILDQTNRSGVYMQIAMILTYFYNVDTFEQIYPWHHAAGDFIVNIGAHQHLSVKLITVRNYHQVFDFEAGDQDLETVLYGLLLFFIQLTVKNRVDRLDGVGNYVWIDSYAIWATIKGFFRGLSKQAKNGLIPKQLIKAFLYYLSLYDQSRLYEVASQLMASSNFPVPENELIGFHLKTHIAALYRTIHKMNMVKQEGV